jgi:hypothetical protein
VGRLGSTYDGANASNERLANYDGNVGATTPVGTDGYSRECLGVDGGLVG